MPEHYCSHFDHNFLPAGLALYESLRQHAGEFVYWVVCLDTQVEEQLRQFDLPDLRIIPLAEIESDALLRVKPGRNRAEYCWTLTPFVPLAVLDRCPEVQRVTYLDADLYFFDAPELLIGELDQEGKHVLITEHAYDPQYDLSATSGRFCVQFITFRQTPEAREVLTWWRDQCLEWCFDRMEDGRYGDQKYLDCWPERFGEAVHVCTQTEKTLAPWNVAMVADRHQGRLEPVFYHFQGLRIVSSTRVRLYSGYRIGAAGHKLYDAYMAALRREARRLADYDIQVPALPVAKPRLAFLRHLKWVYLTRTVRYASLDEST